MALITWQDSYSVKVREIDDQHKQLFQLINELHDAMKAGQARGLMAKVLDRLIQYTRLHFSEEEEMLAKASYAEFVPHVALHRGFTERVEKFAREFKAGNVVITVDVMNFLQEWLVNHIMKVDQKYSACLAGR